MINRGDRIESDEELDRTLVNQAQAGIKKAATIMFVVVLLAFIVYGIVEMSAIGAAAQEATPTVAPTAEVEMPTTRLENTFVDVNGDGLVDYVLQADVVINEPTPTATVVVPAAPPPAENGNQADEVPDPN